MIILILLLSASLRLFGLSWDQGMHLHPDERMIIMVADRIRLPVNWSQFLSPESIFNPKFFAYGSLPIYLLNFAGTLFNRGNYDGLLYTGRILSASFDVGTTYLVYLIAKILIRKQKKASLVPILASFFYALAVLPIQSSHFFISDIPLTFFFILLLFLLLKLIHKELPIRTMIQTGIALGLLIATKITGVLIAVPTALSLFIHFFLFRKIKNTIFIAVFIFILAIAAFSITMPYAILDFARFKAHTIEQSHMRIDPYVFPFTLQYVGTVPYWYFLKNILLWGLGLPLGLISFSGTLYVMISTGKKFLTYIYNFLIHKVQNKKNKSDIFFISSFILLTFFTVYFLFMGISAVKFMRYMLPTYPLLCIFGAWFMFRIMECLSRKKRFLFLLLSSIMVFIWPVSFLSIYVRPHTRIAATQWINQNIPKGSNIAIEHWDDLVPLFGGEKYKFLEMPMYENDNAQWKWKKVEDNLQKADYLIEASNRLYVPLPKLADCSKFRVCYPKTTQYYKDLFSGKLGFTKVKEFSSYPTIPFLNLPINDDNADESFTVYEHPKIIIFRKTSSRVSP